MRTGAKLYYIAFALALTAGLIIIIDDGFNSDEYLRVGILSIMAIAMLWLGSREGSKPADKR